MKKNNFYKKYLKEIEPHNIQNIYLSYVSRYRKEYSVIFDHCSSYLNRLMNDKQYKIFLLNSASINLVLFDINNESIYLVLPEINLDEFKNLYRDAKESDIKMYIRSLTKEYIEINNFLISSEFPNEIIIRSDKEQILSTKMVTNMFGKKYLDFRKTINKIKNKNKKILSSLDNIDIIDLECLVKNWSKTQGKKYINNKNETDLQYIKYFLENKYNNNFLGMIIYYNNKLCGISLVEIVRDNYAVYIMNKALNGFTLNDEIYGISGLSKYLYYATTLELLKKNINFLNIGAIGVEDGTKKCKESLNPLSVNLKSYQINYI